MKIPIGLAIALLKDRSGQINLDVPVTGTTDDPEFQYRPSRYSSDRQPHYESRKPHPLPFWEAFSAAERNSVTWSFDYGRMAVNDAGSKKD